MHYLDSLKFFPLQSAISNPIFTHNRITSYNVCYTKLLRYKNKPALEVVLTTLHAGGKFDHSAYKVSGGLHGVGVSCVNALSEYLEVKVKRDGKRYFQRYERGAPVTDVMPQGDAEGHGTTVRFRPDEEIFETNQFIHERNNFV